jgi:hypothetical protein
MTQTLNVFRGYDGELTIVATGMPAPPSVANLDNEASIILTPAKVEHGFALSTMRDAAVHEANGWWGNLPGRKEATEAHLALTIDGRIQLATVGWPERKQPEPPQPAPRKTRGRPRKQKGSIPLASTAHTQVNQT